MGEDQDFKVILIKFKANLGYMRFLFRNHIFEKSKTIVLNKILKFFN